MQTTTVINHNSSWQLTHSSFEGNVFPGFSLSQKPEFSAQHKAEVLIAQCWPEGEGKMLMRRK